MIGNHKLIHLLVIGHKLLMLQMKLLHLLLLQSHVVLILVLLLVKQLRLSQPIGKGHRFIGSMRHNYCSGLKQTGRGVRG